MICSANAVDDSASAKPMNSDVCQLSPKIMATAPISDARQALPGGRRARRSPSAWPRGACGLSSRPMMNSSRMMPNSASSRNSRVSRTRKRAGSRRARGRCRPRDSRALCRRRAFFRAAPQWSWRRAEAQLRSASCATWRLTGSSDVRLGSEYGASKLCVINLID